MSDVDAIMVFPPGTTGPGPAESMAPRPSAEPARAVQDAAAPLPRWLNSTRAAAILGFDPSPCLDPAVRPRLRNMLGPSPDLVRLWWTEDVLALAQEVEARRG
jgi:hypothetical protein